MRKSFFFLLAALVLAYPSASIAATSEAAFRGAWVEDSQLGGTIYYLADRFRSKPSDDVQLLVLRRINPGDPFNSPKEDVDALTRVLKATASFTADNFVAVVSSRDEVRIYVRGLPRLAPIQLHGRTATVTQASATEIARLKRMGLIEFATYIAKRGRRADDLQRRFFSEDIPVAREFTLRLRFAVPPGSNNSRLQDTLRRAPTLNDIKFEVSAQGDELEIQVREQFSEQAVVRQFTALCRLAETAGSRCTDWNGAFDPIRIESK